VLLLLPVLLLHGLLAPVIVLAVEVWRPKELPLQLLPATAKAPQQQLTAAAPLPLLSPALHHQLQSPALVCSLFVNA
jgi:hypothetical protein